MTPEERREKAIDAFDGGPWAVLAYELLLAHFDETEPALADAIRFGIRHVGTYTMNGDHYSINYPPGHPKA